MASLDFALFRDCYWWLGQGQTRRAIGELAEGDRGQRESR